MAAKEIKMRRAPGGDIVIVVAIRDRAANDQEQDFRQGMKDPADIARIINCGQVFQEHREPRLSRRLGENWGHGMLRIQNMP
jgi:hypothetical protein